MSPSNQGRELDALLDDIAMPDLNAATAALWKEVDNHPGHASCDCPALEALAVLYEKGYRLTKPADYMPTAYTGVQLHPTTDLAALNHVMNLREGERNESKRNKNGG